MHRSTYRHAILWVLLLWEFCCESKVQVDPAVGRFVLSDSREATFHGLCVTESSELQKVPGLVNITNEKARELRSLGFNVLRVGIHWSLYEVAPNTYNETYLSELAGLVNRLGNEHKFYIILDMHQDQLSERFCAGHGVPPFYAKVRDPKYQRGGRRAFPWPVAAPRYENQTRSAPFIDCSTFLRKHKGSAVDLYTYYLGKAFQEIYDNIDGKLDAFGRFWQRVAEKFRASPYVLAYEILNEPWYGEVDLIRGVGGVDGWTVNDTIYFQWANVQNFQNKLNKQLHKAIRQYDNRTIILWEPAAGGSRYHVLPTGFTEGPGGEEYNDRQAFSYHVYCANATRGGPWGGGAGGKAEGLNRCSKYVNISVDVRRMDSMLAGAGGAAIVTEFGQNNNDTAGILAMKASLEGFERVRHSWTLWSVQMMHYYQKGGVPGIKWNASAPPPNFASVLARPYVQYLHGRLANSSVQSADEKQTLWFFFEVAEKQSVPLRTEVYFPFKDKAAVSLEFFPPHSCSDSQVSHSFVSFLVDYDSVRTGDMVKVNITRRNYHEESS
jgi:hypothetical protein